MMKRAILCGVFILTGAVGSVRATQIEQPIPGLWDVIRGKVSFQRRQTVVPLSLCKEGERCPRSKPYWTIIVAAGNGLFELDETFALGKEVPPQSLQVAGLSVRAGVQVILEAKVDAIADDYGMISEIKSLEIVSDTAGN